MFSKLVILSCLLALAHAGVRPRIANGEDAHPGQYPYQVNLYHKDTLNRYLISFCGGAILDKQWILSAASCRDSQSDINNIVGKAGNVYFNKPSETEQQFEIDAIFVHPKYEVSFVQHYDIALYKLKTPLEFNEFVAPVELPKSESTPSGRGTISGIGSIKHMMTVSFPDVLQTVDLPIISNDECKKLLKAELGEYFEQMDIFDDARFCTGPTKSNQGYCLHDSGNVLVTKENGKNVAVGVATFGFAADCETPKLPSLYTRISAFNDWIQETISKN